jgi:hypothetical protein
LDASNFLFILKEGCNLQWNQGSGNHVMTIGKRQVGPLKRIGQKEGERCHHDEAHDFHNGIVGNETGRFPSRHKRDNIGIVVYAL